jgi:hypothetical protein
MYPYDFLRILFGDLTQMVEHALPKQFLLRETPTKLYS